MNLNDRAKLLREILPVLVKKYESQIKECVGPNLVGLNREATVKKELTTEILYGLKRGDFVNLLISAGLPADYARKYEKDILDDGEDAVERECIANSQNELKEGRPVSSGNIMPRMEQ